METKNTPLTKARNWCARQFSKRRPDRYNEHPSHLASEILGEAETKYFLGTSGVEGFCDEVGASGLSYLNAGDTYAQTIICRTTRNSARFSVGDWGSIVEADNGRTFR